MRRLIRSFPLLRFRSSTVFRKKSVNAIRASCAALCLFYGTVGTASKRRDRPRPIDECVMQFLRDSEHFRNDAHRHGVCELAHKFDFRAMLQRLYIRSTMASTCRRKASMAAGENPLLRSLRSRVCSGGSMKISHKLNMRASSLNSAWRLRGKGNNICCARFAESLGSFATEEHSAWPIMTIPPICRRHPSNVSDLPRAIEHKSDTDPAECRRRKQLS